VKLDILGKNEKGEKQKAWHRSYRCSGIKYCEFAHEYILSINSAYNDVKLEHINDLRNRYTSKYIDLPIFQRIYNLTNAYYYAFIQN
jgi:hypothetical protein